MLYPQKLINVKTKAGFDWTADEQISAAVLAAEKSLAGKGRVLLRASGTEPVLRVMVEGQAADEVARHAEMIAAVVAAAIKRT